MIMYIEDYTISKEIFNQLNEQEKKYLISSEKYNYDDNDNYLFSIIYKNKQRKNIGFIDVILDTSLKQPFIALAVLPEFRKKGIATQLLKEAEKEAKLKGYYIIYYTINNESNIPSIKFAEKNGFEKDYQIGTFISMKKSL